MNSDRDGLRAAVARLRDELRKQRFRKLPIERAFIEWYVLARYGNGASPEVTDGAGDGGIDALVREGDTRVVIQAKYEPSVALKALRNADLARHEDLASRVRDPQRQHDFDGWLEKVRPELRAKYKAVRKAALESRPVRFDLVTTKRVNSYTESLSVVDLQRIAALWALYEEGFTPPVEKIELAFEDLWNTGTSDGGFRIYVGLADTRALLRLMDDDEHERLFAQNVRTDLRTRINRAIRATYEEEPETFWLGNNGLYIVCRGATQQGRSVSLIYPSIINGSQTLHALHSSKKRHACRILVRILEMDITGRRELLTSIIRRTNTQNPMRAMNLAAHDREQLNIARFLDGCSVFYERRQREWINEKKGRLVGYLPVTIKEMGQWLAVTQGHVGMGTARARVATVFSDPVYSRVFADFGDNLTAPVYERLAAAVWAGLCSKRFLRTLGKSARGRARIAFLAVVRSVYDAVRCSPQLTARVRELLTSRAHVDVMNGRVRSTLSTILREMFIQQRRAARKDATLDPSNFFKRDDLTGGAYRRAVTTGRRRRLGRLLESLV